MNRKHYGTVALSLALLFPLLIAAAPLFLQDGGHTHPQLETLIAANSTNDAFNRATDDRQETRLAQLSNATPILITATLAPSTTPSRTSTPSSTPTPTRTNTPGGVPPTPTIEEAVTASVTPFSTNTPIRTNTPTGTPVATRPPFLDPEFTCTVRTTDNLTKRATGAPSAASMGTLTEGSMITIAPYNGTIPYSTTNGLWYVPAMEGGQIAYYILYARTTPPSEATPGFTPSVIESYLESADPNIPCIPVIRRS